MGDAVVVGGVAIVLAGAAMATASSVERRRGGQSVSWPTVSGVIVASRVTTDGDDTYWASLVYDYTVAGRRYRGTRVLFGDGGSPRRGDAVAVVATHPVGHIVAVRYDPRRPGTAVLKAGENPHWWGLQVVGVLVIVVGLIIAISG